MKRICLIVSIMIVLFGSVLVLDTYRATRTVQAQADPNAPAAQLKTYLPFISLSVPTPTPTPPSRIKARSGIHMGNRGIGKDWPLTVFQLITGTATGIFPAATVVQSSQLFNFHRSTSAPCRIDSVKEVRAQHLYDYLKMAIQRGTIVIIRITPSPGNFTDYNDLGNHHILLTDASLPGADYCDPKNANNFRDILDIANEMEAIYTWFMQQTWFTQQGGHQDQLYFEPANEPNNEWYPTLYDVQHNPIIIAPNLPSSESWRQMDSYFSNLYDLAHAKQAHLQILAPSMGQRKYAEPMYLGKCGFMAVDNVNGQSGYDFMPGTYNSDRFEGYSWHNYWDYLTEQLDITVSLEYCRQHETYIATSQHLFQFLSHSMLMHIIERKKPVFMTEADVMSPCQDADNQIDSKISQWDRTQNSLHNFIANESIANDVIVWLLVQEDAGVPMVCGNHNYEISWHEAYEERGGSVIEAEWFQKWWARDEN